jgi:putative phosphoesterase
MAKKAADGVRIGVISDTHGYLDAHVADVFAGVDHIIHAGDIMDAEQLAALRAIAPLTAVAGNLDRGELADLPREVAGEIAGVSFVVGHKRKRLLNRLAQGKIAGVPKHKAPDLIVFGHEHITAVEWVDGSLYLNPGTASSPDEEDDDPTVAVVEVVENGLSARFVPLRRSRGPFPS